MLDKINPELFFVGCCLLWLCFSFFHLLFLSFFSSFLFFFPLVDYGLAGNKFLTIPQPCVCSACFLPCCASTVDLEKYRCPPAGYECAYRGYFGCGNWRVWALLKNGTPTATDTHGEFLQGCSSSTVVAQVPRILIAQEGIREEISLVNAATQTTHLGTAFTHQDVNNLMCRRGYMHSANLPPQKKEKEKEKEQKRSLDSSVENCI